MKSFKNISLHIYKLSIHIPKNITFFSMSTLETIDIFFIKL